jgi:hypothetical protein
MIVVAFASHGRDGCDRSSRSGAVVAPALYRHRFGAPSTWETNLTCDRLYATWTSAAGNQEKLPINCVDWYPASQDHPAPM